jgi:translation initiation factor IF-1
MMILKRIVGSLLALTITSASLAAQQPADADVWRTFARGLQPNAFVQVHLKDGRTIKGHVLGSSDDTLRISPKTRVAVPLQQLSFGDITSIEMRKAPKMNPGSKVLLGVGIGLGIYLLAGAILLAGGGFD